MSRTSLFILVVLIGTAAVAGVFALARTSAATGGSDATAPAADQQISYRLKQLDRLEAGLRAKLAQASKPVPSSAATSTPVSSVSSQASEMAQPATVYVRRPGVTVITKQRGESEPGESERGESERGESDGEPSGERDD